MSTRDNPTNGPLSLIGLTLAALGIVYGDIGTSPLYSMRITLSAGFGVSPTESNILGVISLIVWSLIMLISIKYLVFVLRADNQGEGGIMALMALVIQNKPKSSKRTLYIFLGLFGASLLYADGLITPAISVLSAVEGLNIGDYHFSQSFIIFISLMILLVLFWMQQYGTQTVGSIFGPIMLLWFLSIGLLGMFSIYQVPSVLNAISPWYAINFLISNEWQAFVTMGAIFLAVTGGEALYADMGHFGIIPIRWGWFTFVFPALTLNYFGQGAWLLSQFNNPEHIIMQHGEAVLKDELLKNLFYRNVPAWGLYPMIILATISTVIASQAIISGAFSLTRQAIHMGYCPRLSIIHTSKLTIGQVYMPLVNGLMLVGTFCLVLGFKNSDSLAGAYGLAVSLTMLITTIFMATVMRELWKWKLSITILVTIPFLCIDLTFCMSNFMKIAEGGWVPLLISFCFIIIMTTWHQGRRILIEKGKDGTLLIDDFIADVSKSKPHRVPGVSLFLTGDNKRIPSTLMHNYKHNKILHRQIVLATIRTLNLPIVARENRVEVIELAEGFTQLKIYYGFMEYPNLAELLLKLNIKGLNLRPNQVTFFLGRKTLILTHKHNLYFSQKILFEFLSRNAWDASKFYNIPPNRVIEIGSQLEL